MIMNLLTPKNIIISIVIAVATTLLTWLGTSVYNKIYTAGANSVQVKWDEAERARAVEIEILKQTAEKATNDIKQKAKAQQKASDEKIATLNKSLAIITSRLRDRTERPSVQGVSENATTGSNATGAQLYREDAEFLIGEAARAETIKIQLETCTKQYNAVYEAFLEFEKK